MNDQTLSVGAKLDDFKITLILGQGGFGVTYKAVDERLLRDVAIKEYLPAQFAYRDDTATVRPRSPQDVEVFTWGLNRFIDEARALAKFKHPNIVAVIRYFEANGTAYLVMEYEEGKDLERWILGRSEAIPEALLIDRIALPLLDGLTKIHDAGLLHRDIKPENVFIRRDGSPLLIDFGSSRPHGQGQSSNLTSIVSAGYSPFEQYGGANRQGPWSDLYAFAGTLYRIVVGKAPTDAIARHQGIVQPSAVDAAAGQYSEQLLRAIDQALALDPTERPQSAAEFEALLPGGRASIADTSAATQLRRPAKGKQSSRARAVALVVGVVVVIAATGVFVWPTLQQRTQTAPIDPAVSPARVERADDSVAGPAPPATGVATSAASVDPLDERAIFADWNVPEDVENYRNNQIAGALLAYTANKEKFDDCLAAGCEEQAALMEKLGEALRGYEWSRGNFQGIVRLENPRRLSNEQCLFLIDVDETLRDGNNERRQHRSYCTRDGYDRRVERAGLITGGPIVESPS